MWEKFPLTLGWQAVRRRPFLWAVPLAWDLAKWSLATVLPLFGLFFRNWDFTVGYTWSSGDWLARFVLPPALPSVAQLGITLAPPSPTSPSLWQYGVMVLILALESVLKGGYLNLVNGVLHGVPPTLGGLMRGARRFGLQLFLIALIWMGFHSGISSLMASGRLSSALMIPLSALFIGLLWLAEFITVVEDVWPPTAIFGAPLVLWAQISGVLVVLVASGLISGVVTGLASLAGVPWFVVLAPIQAVLGTWLAASMLQALQEDISTRAEQTGWHSWACPNCRTNNHPWSTSCVACGSREDDTTPTNERADQVQ